MPIEIGILKLIHILCLVYWLGADLGVFYSSYYLVNEKLSRDTRINVSKNLVLSGSGAENFNDIDFSIWDPSSKKFGLHKISHIQW